MFTDQSLLAPLLRFSGVGGRDSKGISQASYYTFQNKESRLKTDLGELGYEAVG